MKLIFTALILIALTTVGAFWLYQDKPAPGEVMEECDQVKLQSIGSDIFEATRGCFGIISLQGGFGENYTLYDNIHKINIAEVGDVSDIFYTENNIYFIAQNPLAVHDNIHDQYIFLYMSDGILKKYIANSVDTFPKYYRVDTQNGDVQFFTDANQIPDAEKEYFRAQ